MARINGGGSGGSPIAITDTFVCGDQTCMLTLNAQTGDVCVRTDQNKTYILQINDPTVLSNWVQLLFPLGLEGTGAVKQVGVFSSTGFVQGYADFTYDVTPEVFIMGPGNTGPTSAGYALVGGWNNASTAARSIVWGEGLVISGASAYNAIFGYSSTANALGGTLGLLYGSSATGTGHLIGGATHTVDGTYNVVGGHGQFVAGVGDATFGGTNYVTGYYNFVGGFANTQVILSGFSGDYNAVFGKSNIWNGQSDKNIITGESNTVTGNKNAVFGATHNVTASHNIVSGMSNTLNTGSDWNAVFGDNHVLTTAFESLVAGSTNIVHGGYRNSVLGYNNSLGGNSHLIVGNANVLSTSKVPGVDGCTIMVGRTHNSDSSFSAIFGESNLVSGSHQVIGGQLHSVVATTTHNAVFGQGHTVHGSIGHNIIAGLTNYVDGARNALFGESTPITGSYNISAGYDHVGITGDANAVFGWQNTVTGNYNAVFGNTNPTAGADNLVGGTLNTISGSYNLVGGTNHNNNGGSYDIIGGAANSMGNGTHNIIAGSGNFVDHGASYNIVGGQTNTLTGAVTHSVIGGKSNTITVGGVYSAVFGESNSVDHDHSIVAGKNNNIDLAGSYSIVFGRDNYTNGTHDVIIGYSNTNLYGNSCYALGYSNGVADVASFAIGASNSITGQYNVGLGFNNSTGGGAGSNHLIDIGTANTIWGTYNIAMGWYIANKNDNSDNYSIGLGYYANMRQYGEVVHAAGRFSANGDAQTSQLVARKITTNDTPTEIALDGATNYLSTEDNTAYAFVVTITAKKSGALDHAMYRLEWSTVRGTGVGSVTVDGLVKTVIFETDSTWDVNVTADITNGRPAIMLTGVAATTINWVAKIEMTEVTV
jgi:hypothetical protein